MEPRRQLRDYSAPVEPICVGSDRLDGLIALLVAVVVGGVGLLTQLPGLTPDLWQEVAEAAGLRPALVPRDGVWHLLVGGLFAGTGDAKGLAVVRVAGPVAVGLTTGLVYLFLRNFLPFWLRLSSHAVVWRRRVERVLLAAAGMAFAFSAPVARLAQAFAPATLALLLAAGAATVFLRFLQTGRVRYIAACAFLAGLLVAETPFGLVLVVVALVAWLVLPRCIATINARMVLLDPVVVSCSRWPVSFVFLASVAAGIACDVVLFARAGGLSVQGWSGFDCALAWIVGYGRLALSSCTPLGAALVAVGTIFPFGVTLGFLPAATDEDRLVGFRRGWVFLFAGVFAILQFGGIDFFRYLTWGNENEAVSSPLLQALLMGLNLWTVAACLTVAGVDLCCRNHEKILLRRLPERESTERGIFLRRIRSLWRGARLLFVWGVPCALVAFAGLPRVKDPAREVREVLLAAGEEMLSEAAGAQVLVTDGAFDPMLELEGAVRGSSLRMLAFYGTANQSYEKALRLRGAPTEGEDRKLLEQSAPAAVRAWVERRSPRLDTMAFQVGFEAWQRVKRPGPLASGLVARPTGMTAATAAEGVERARGLAERVLSIVRSGRLASTTRVERGLLNRILWRLARLARVRAASADAAGDAKGAAREQKFADELDAANAARGRLAREATQARLASETVLSPREGLDLALKRGDFALARRFAEPVIASEPDDPDANFALGMSFLLEEQWARAEEHLSRVLVRKPHEPAVLNNLAAVMLKVGRYDEAERWARQALNELPTSTAIKNTLREIQAARVAAGVVDPAWRGKMGPCP